MTVGTFFLRALAVVESFEHRKDRVWVKLFKHFPKPVD